MELKSWRFHLLFCSPTEGSWNPCSRQLFSFICLTTWEFALQPQLKVLLHDLNNQDYNTIVAVIERVPVNTSYSPKLALAFSLIWQPDGKKRNWITFVVVKSLPTDFFFFHSRWMLLFILPLVLYICLSHLQGIWILLFMAILQCNFFFSHYNQICTSFFLKKCNSINSAPISGSCKV